MLFSMTHALPLCTQCRFFSQPFLTQSKFGKCKKFPNMDEPDYFLVDRKNEHKGVTYSYCATARKSNNMCGDQGKLFEPKL